MNFIVDGPGSGPVNMAKDAELLAQSVLSCRLYSWDGLWVSLGRYQHPERVLKSPQIPHVSRPTGGKAVVHGADLTVSIIAPLAVLNCTERSVEAVYFELTRPLIAAMRASGLPATLAKELTASERGSHTADCFAYTSPNDIVHEVTRKKVCGCALRITTEAALLQASIPVRPYLSNPAELVHGGASIELANWNSQEFERNLRQATR